LDEGRGVDSGRAIGTAQGDAIRNMTGSALVAAQTSGFSGVFVAGGNTSRITGAQPGTTPAFTFNAAAQVPTAAENRPRNIALLACIKW
jgi:hypothetical protein